MGRILSTQFTSFSIYPTWNLPDPKATWSEIYLNLKLFNLKSAWSEIYPDLKSSRETGVGPNNLFSPQTYDKLWTQLPKDIQECSEGFGFA